MSEPVADAERFVPPPDARPDDRPWPAFAWPLPPGTELRGGTVRLTPVDPDADAPALYAALDDDRVWAHVAGRPGSPQQYAQALRARVDAGWLVWLVRAARPVAGLPQGAVLGTSAYLEVSPLDARLEVGATAYRPLVWGTEVNPETKLLLLGHAFDVLRAGRVQLKTDVRNVRSQQAVARLGARYEGTLRRYQRRADGTVRDTVLFSVVAEEWPQVRARLQARLPADGRDPGRRARPGGSAAPTGGPAADPRTVAG